MDSISFDRFQCFSREISNWKKILLHLIAPTSVCRLHVLFIGNAKKKYSKLRMCFELVFNWLDYQQLSNKMHETFLQQWNFFKDLLGRIWFRSIFTSKKISSQILVLNRVESMNKWNFEMTSQIDLINVLEYVVRV